ncbi:hypothetical protein ACFW04_011703 [Cataglyphis niger]
MYDGDKISVRYMRCSHDKSRCIPRILIRRFALRRTAYKYLDIGISVGPESFVELHFSDIRGNRIILSHETWEIFIKRRVNIERFLQSNTPSSLIEYLVTCLGTC